MRVPPIAAILAAGLAAGSIVIGVLAARAGEEAGHREPGALALIDIPGISGTLLVTSYGAGWAGGRDRGGISRAGIAGPRHVTTLVNGAGYAGMEDNDLRGFLDGTYKFGWNQPGQIHVRAGRRDRGARYGEYELFRVLQRWEPVRLPNLARVTRAALVLGIEAGPAAPIRLLLYRVNRDWNPGTGGTLNDNVSPPKPGEVWWNDVAYPDSSWGLPGVGYAARHDPRADTDAMPLAEARFQPGDSAIIFDSDALAAYAGERLHAGLPLLFLLKVADYQEDVTGSMVYVYSGNHGDSRNPARRPRLVLEWEAGGETATHAERVRLEHGRAYLTPRLPARGGRWHAMSFAAEPGQEPPLIEVRGGRGDEAGKWVRATIPIEADWEWVQARVSALVDPVALGRPFTAELRDTWVRTAAPERQAVPWTFTSPTGVAHRVDAEYVGGHTWKVRFAPDEVGRWRYRWSQRFIDEPYESADGVFDVVLADLAGAQAAVRSLETEIRALQADASAEARERLMIRFARLERAIMKLQTPRRFRADSAAAVRALLRRAREAWGETVPDPVPLEPSPPPAWAREAARR